MKYLLILILSILFSGTNVLSQSKTENVILITFDGLRWQEVFGGADLKLITNKQFVNDTTATKSMFWATSPELRREKLMPFFWHTLVKNGQLYGNRIAGNNVNVTNSMWFSYPGYNELLTGAADDKNITSNDQFDNPNQTVLELLNQHKKYAGKVAAFTSWENFPWIINTKRSGVPVNAGFMKENNSPSERERFMNELIFQLPNESGGTRLDAFTFHYAFEYLKKSRPKVLFISFDETDHFAHAGEYDKYLSSAHATDTFINQLWEWIQTQPDYKNKTTLILTTDHGRGDLEIDHWKHHGKKIPNCDQIWMAFIGPDSPVLGEVKFNQQLYQDQIASTMLKLLGVGLTTGKKMGEPVNSVFSKH